MARLHRRKSGEDGIFDPNMTPLIDVSLVLVVILMVATPMAFQSSLAVQAASSSGRDGVTARTERIEIEVRADGVQINRFLVPREALTETLAPLLRESATRAVVVRCADDVSHGAFVSVIDEARSLGAASIAVVGGS